MSFADVRGGGGGGGAGGLGGVAGGAGARRADPELVALQRDVFRATTAVSQFKRSVDQVGTPKDTRKLREKMCVAARAAPCSRVRVHGTMALARARRAPRQTSGAWRLPR